MPLPGLRYIAASQQGSFTPQIVVSNDAVCRSNQIGVRIKARIEKPNRYTLSRVPLIRIEPRGGRNYRKPIRRVLVIMSLRFHTDASDSQSALTYS